MKALYLLLFGLLAYSNHHFAQVTGFGINNLYLAPNFNPVSCDQTVTIGFSALSPAPNASYNFDIPYVIQGNNFTGFNFKRSSIGAMVQQVTPEVAPLQMPLILS